MPKYLIYSTLLILSLQLLITNSSAKEAQSKNDDITQMSLETLEAISNLTMNI